MIFLYNYNIMERAYKLEVKYLFISIQHETYVKLIQRF